LLQNGVKVLAVTGLAALSFALLVYQPEQGISTTPERLNKKKKKTLKKALSNSSLNSQRKKGKISKRKQGKPIFLMNPVNLAEDPGQKLARTHLEITVKFLTVSVNYSCP